jgi:hypothetical protein
LRQHEALRPNDVRCLSEQYFALDERLTHKAELEVLKITQAAMDELGARGRCSMTEIAHLGEQHRKSAAGSIDGNADAIDPAADYYEVVGHVPKLARGR